jgi:hypothetical protein
MDEPTLVNNEATDLNPQIVDVIDNLVRVATRYRIPKMEDVNRIGLQHKAYDLKPMSKIYNREANGVATDVVVNDFINDPRKTYNFMNVICIFFNRAIDYYCKSKGLKKSTVEKPGDIYFMYKGGNVLRLLYNEFKKNIPVSSIQIADEFFAKSFKKSDSDFSIIVNPELADYDRVFDDMVSLSYVLQTLIRKLFNRAPKGDMFDVFAFVEYNESKKDLILKQMIEDLNAMHSIQDPENEDFYGARFCKVKVMGHTYHLPHSGADAENEGEYQLDEDEMDKSEATIDMEKRVDFGIDKCNTNQICVYSLTSPEDSDHLYISANRSLDFTSGTSDALINFKFTLVRTKLNATAYMVKDGQKKIKMLGGEVIDCTVIHKNSYGNTTAEEFEHNKEYISKYSLSLPGTKYRLEFFGYNLKGLIHDLELILYQTVAKPWEDMKYGKRINRLFFLYMVDLFRNVLDNDQRIEKVQKFRVGVIEHLRRALDTTDRVEYEKMAKNIELFDPEVALSVSAKEFERIALISFDDKDGLRDMLNTVDQNTKSMVDILNDTQKYINSDGNYMDSVYQGSVSSMAGGKYMNGGAQLPSWLLDAAPPDVVQGMMPGTENDQNTGSRSMFAPQTNASSYGAMTDTDNDTVLTHALSELESDLNKFDVILGGLNV